MGLFGFDSVQDMFDGGGRGASRESSSSSRSSSSADRGSSSGDRPSSIEINGRTVTDPKQVERIERNREASARYAVDAYQREGTPIPAHLRDTVDRQIERGAYGSTGGGSQRGNLLDLFLGPPPGSTASILGTPRQAPTPGPNYYAGLGQPGMAREGTAPSGFAPPVSSLVATDPAAAAAPVSEEPVADPGLVIPNLAMLASPQVGFNPETQFTFEQYLAQLQGGQGGGMVAPPPVAPIAGAPSFGMSPGMDQGIGSLVPPPVIAPLQPPPMAGINPPATPPILYFGPDGRPVYGGIA